MIFFTKNLFPIFNLIKTPKKLFFVLESLGKTEVTSYLWGALRCREVNHNGCRSKQFGSTKKAVKKV